MKNLLCILVCVIAIEAAAQTPIEKTFPVQSAKELTIDVDHPNVRIHTYDKAEVLIKGTVSINAGESDSAFELQSTNTDGILSINSFIKDKENLPRHIVIVKGEQQYVFKASSMDDPAVKKFMDENGRDYTYIMNSLLIEVNLEIFVPKNLKTSVYAKHGIVEFTKFEGSLKVDAKHGKIDATIPANIGDLVVRSRYGEILSNLDIKFDQNSWDAAKKDKWTEVAAHRGNGPAYFLESKHGTVYLRKP